VIMRASARARVEQSSRLTYLPSLRPASPPFVFPSRPFLHSHESLLSNLNGPALLLGVRSPCSRSWACDAAPSRPGKMWMTLGCGTVQYSKVQYPIPLPCEDYLCGAISNIICRPSRTDAPPSNDLDELQRTRKRPWCSAGT